MNRQEHMEWAKARALDYCKRGDPVNGLASMFSDLDKHPETKGHKGVEIGVQLMMIGALSSVEKARSFIEGFR